MKKESAMMISLVLIVVIVLASLSLFNMDVTGRVISPGFTCGSYSNVIPNIVTSSSSFGSNFLPTRAIDNDYSTAWVGGSDSGADWIQFDLARVRCIREIDLGISSYYLPALVDVQVSVDGDTWKTVSSDWKVEDAQSLNRKVFASTEAKYVKVVFKTPVQGGGEVQGSGSGSVPYTQYRSVSEVRLTIARLTPVSGSGASGSGALVVPAGSGGGLTVVDSSSVSSVECLDNDGGSDIGVEGSAVIKINNFNGVSGNTFTGVYGDHCISDSILVENRCVGAEALSDRYSCAQGCSEGICVGGEGTLITDAPADPSASGSENPGGPGSPGGSSTNKGSSSSSSVSQNGNSNNVDDNTGSDNVVKLDSGTADNPPISLKWLWWVLLLLVVLGGIIWYVYKKSEDGSNSTVVSSVPSKPVSSAPSKPLVSNVKSPMKVKAK